jgi:hypothetical protein
VLSFRIRAYCRQHISIYELYYSCHYSNSYNTQTYELSIRILYTGLYFYRGCDFEYHRIVYITIDPHAHIRDRSLGQNTRLLVLGSILFFNCQ